MTDKRRMHHWWRTLRYVRVWQLLILLLISGGVSIELLRENNLNMISLRNAVKVADAQGNQQKIQAALISLQQYVSSHMNTAMGTQGVYLENTYEQAYNRAIQQAVQSDTREKDLYFAADDACHSVFEQTYSFPAYTQCVAAKLVGQPGADPLASAQLPSVNLFRYNYVSPVWSPDAAGWALVITCLLALLLLSRVFLVWSIRLIMKRHNRLL